MALQANGVSFDLLFLPRSTAKRTDVNIDDSGIDISNLYEKNTGPTEMPIINWQSGGVDISTMFKIGPGALKSTTVLTTQRGNNTNGWVSLIEHSYTVSFPTVAAANEFFQYSGRIEHSLLRQGTISGAEDSKWQTLTGAGAFGTMSFGLNGIYQTQNGTGGDVPTNTNGWNTIPISATYVTVAAADDGGFLYNGDRIDYKVRKPTSTSLEFRISLIDANPTDAVNFGTFSSFVVEKKFPTLPSPTFNETIIFV